MENECEALPGVAYPGVRDNRSTLNTKTGYDDDDDDDDDDADAVSVTVCIYVRYVTVLVELTRIEGTKHGRLIAAQMLDVAIRVAAVRAFVVVQMVSRCQSM